MSAHLTAREVAERIGIKPHTLSVWRVYGRGPAYVRLGGPRGRAVYPADALERWLAERTFANTSEETVAAERR